MGNWLRTFMQGRYGQRGVDGFGWFLMIIGLILSGAPFVWVISPLVGGWEVYRLLSRDLSGRTQENRHFLELVHRGTHWMSPLLLPLKRTAGKVMFRLAGAGLSGARKGRNAYLGGKRKLKTALLQVRERKTSVFVRCPQCRKLLRLPRGKGRLEVNCPVCRHTFMQRT
jgi:hypothetical protein